MNINAERLWARIEKLSEITDSEQPWTRRSFTPLFVEGRRWLREEFRKAGLEPEIDAGGNLTARLAGNHPTLKPIVLGSHSDTVPSGGRYDGILGVMCALEVAECVKESGQALNHPLEICDFLAEEPSEFGLSCIGSRALAGELTPEMLDLTRPDGMSLRQGLRFVGGDPENLSSIKRSAESTAAYLEVHIEQGRVLESNDVRVGVVTGIAGIHRERLVITGRADHAGATPMTLRADALVGACHIIGRVHDAALAGSTEARALVATVGRIEVTPNAANVVPGTATMTIEVRSGDESAITGFARDIVRDATPVLDKLGLDATLESISHVSPTPCAGTVRESIRAAAENTGISSLELPSGAGHDGMFMAKTGPIGMIFTPCLDGRSHVPEESIEPQQAADGATVLAETVRRLDAALG